MANATANEPQTKKAGLIKRRFDGITLLWHIPGTSYLLRLIGLLFGFMIASFAILVLAESAIGDVPILIRLSFYVQLYSLAFFFFILVEVLQFYRNYKKYNSLPEANPPPGTKYWPSKSIKGHGRIIFGTLLAALVSIIVVYGEFFNRSFLLSLVELNLIFSIGYLFFVFFLLFLTPFITAKGSIESYKATYAEKIHHRRLWFFILLPVPWILFIAIFSTAGAVLQLAEVYGYAVAFWNIAGLTVFGFLCLVGLVALFKKNMRTNYTISEIAATLTFLFVIIIPGLTGTSPGSSGPLISLITMAFFYFRGTLNDMGHDLQKQNRARNEKVGESNITSTENISNAENDSGSEKTTLTTALPKAYRNLVLGLLVLLFTYFGVVYTIAPEFSILGIAAGTQQIGLYLQIGFWLEIVGLSLGIIVFTVVSVFRSAKKNRDN
jgi:hypothetical protein